MALAWKAGWVNSPRGFESRILRHHHHARQRRVSAGSPAQDAGEDAAGLLGLLVSGAPLGGGHAGLDGGDVLAAAGPGGLAAGLAADGTTHAVFLSVSGSGGLLAGLEGVGELAEGVIGAGPVDGGGAAVHEE